MGIRKKAEIVLEQLQKIENKTNLIKTETVIKMMNFILEKGRTKEERRKYSRERYRKLHPNARTYKHKTEEQKKEYMRQKQKEYYQKNKEKLKVKRRERYKKLKEEK